MYDITNKQSLNNIENWKEQFIQKSMVVQPDNFPFMVIGNKSDLEDSRVVSKDQAQRVVDELGPNIDLVESSAKDN